MLDFSRLNELIGTPDLLARGKRYAPDIPGHVRPKGQAR
jgi:hypothetical protein